MVIPTRCTLCPRACGADRTHTQGFCGGGAQVKLARAALHFGEEPCISGTRGSGTVFFSGCSLQCCYCQNFSISAENFGKEISVAKLADIFLHLQAQGAHNINLVSATHYVPWILQALENVKENLHIPIVYNTSGYETTDTLASLAGIVDIYLTDLKYYDSVLSDSYSCAPDYFSVASKSTLQMIEQVGTPKLDENGLLQKGVIVRHLALPGAVQDSIALLDFIANELPKEHFLVSLMSQYTPSYRSFLHKTLSRRISTYEYNRVMEHAIALGLTQGYMQQKSSAKAEYTPTFDLTGII